MEDTDGKRRWRAFEFPSPPYCFSLWSPDDFFDGTSPLGNVFHTATRRTTVFVTGQGEEEAFELEPGDVVYDMSDDPTDPEVWICLRE